MHRNRKNVDSRFGVTGKQFASFIARHEAIDVLVTRNKHTDVVVDEWMRFLDYADNGKVPTQSIMNVGVWEAFKESGSDEI